MKPKKFLIIIRDDTQSRVERANLQFDLTRERLHYSRTAVFAIYSNLHTSSANFRVFILPAKNRHTTVSCTFSNYIFQNTDLVKAESSLSNSAISEVSLRKNYRFIHREKSCCISWNINFYAQRPLICMAEFDKDDSALTSFNEV